jgi:hypothetical protein
MRRIKCVTWIDCPGTHCSIRENLDTCIKATVLEKVGILVVISGEVVNRVSFTQECRESC